MTITVNTPVVASGKAAVAPGSVASPDNGSSAADLFASLLGLQMGTVGAMINPTPVVASDAKPLADKPAKDAGQSLAPMDPNSLLLMQQPLAAAVQAAMQPKPDSAAPLVAADISAMTAAKTDAVGLLGAHLPKAAPGDQKNLPDNDAAALQFLPQQQNNALQQAAKAPPLPVLTLSQPMSDPNWSKSLGEQMLSMVNMKADKAQIQLNPPQMGPIEITLKMNGTDQAQVLFTAAVPATREALESNMHRLTSMLASSGIQLTDAQVSSGQSGQQQQQAFQRGNHRQAAAVVEPEGVDALAAIKAARGILSIFA